MPLVDLPDDTKLLMDEHKEFIKDEYITYKLFLDSAVRSRLRRMGKKVPEDKIISHLKRIAKNRNKLKDKMKILRLLKLHERRMKEIVNKLDNLDF